MASDNRQVYQTPPQDLSRLAEALSDLAETFPDLHRADLRIEADGTRYRLLLPHWHDSPAAPEALVRSLRTRLSEAYARVFGQAFDSRTLSRDLSGMGGVETMAALAFRAASLTLDGAPPEGDRLALIEEGAEAELAQILRRGRDASVLVASGGGTIFCARFSSRSEEGALVAGRVASRASGASILCRHVTPGGMLWLAEARGVDPVTLVAFGRILSGLAAAGLLAEGEELILWDRPGRGLTLLRLPPAAPTPVEDFAADKETLQPISVEVLRLDADPAALRVLQDKLVAPRFPIGYRVAVEPVPAWIGGESDLEHLTERISELQAEVRQIQGLAAPQRRLLRFSDDQLPALADGLRRMPSAMRNSPDLTFATAHATGRAGPAHFVLYNPAVVSFDGRLPEYYWRVQTENRPIGFWLDPGAALALMTDPEAPLVFVPDRHRLIPGIDSFGAGIGATLRLVLGRLFADAAEITENPVRQAAFVFTPSPDASFELEVEVLAADMFRPVQLQLKWINDHLLLRSPAVVRPEDVTNLAEELYSGRLARALQAEAEVARLDLAATWAAAGETLAAQIGQLGLRLQTEIAQSVERIDLSRSFLQKAKARIREVDAEVAYVRKALAESEARLTPLRDLPKRGTERRQDFVVELLAELENGLATVEEAARRIEAYQERITQIQYQLRGY